MYAVFSTLQRCLRLLEQAQYKAASCTVSIANVNKTHAEGLTMKPTVSSSSTSLARWWRTVLPATTCWAKASAVNTITDKHLCCQGCACTMQRYKGWLWTIFLHSKSAHRTYYVPLYIIISIFNMYIVHHECSKTESSQMCVFGSHAGYSCIH